MNNPAIIIETLANAPALIVPLINEVPEMLRKRRPSAGKWSAHEHACHLAEVHELFFVRLDLMMQESQPRLLAYNPDVAMEAGALLKVDLQTALEKFTRERGALVEKLKDLSTEDWQRTAQHEEYAHYSVFIMFRHLALHDMLHAYRIEELLLKKDWDES